MKPNKNTMFIHRNILDPFWRPSLKETLDDRPLAIMVVTSVREDKVYFRYVDAPKRKGTFSMSLENWNQFYADTEHIVS